ncbi:hypothetical protein N9M10_03655 [Hellea sp.]|nr:hypothetical protein [Hellea sp.]
MSKFKELDNHVSKAWHTKKFSDGSKIKLGRTDYEHAFIVKADGIFEIEVNERGKYR